jgi:dGTPase
VISYSQLLQAKRLTQSTIGGRTIEDEIESDHARVLYSPAFRRLQQKAQVFSLVENPAVRSRMTHSLEVSDVGRKIAAKAAESLEDKGLLTREQVRAFAVAVETGCLMHDIGNPPFGHLGEAAIKRWFETNWRECCRAMKGQVDEKDEKWAADLIEFDGNPQGIRIVLRLQGIDLREEKGMNLTWTQILTGLKYVRRAGDPKGDGIRKKAGFFATEASLIERALKELNFPGGRRFPLAYLVEVADDISYCISDFEDGIEMRVINQRTFFEQLQKEWRHDGLTGDLKELANRVDMGVGTWQSSTPDDKMFISFKLEFIRRMISAATREYLERQEEVHEGEVAELFQGKPEKDLIDALKTVARKYLFRSYEAENVELAGYNIIQSILNHFRPLLMLPAAQFAELEEPGKSLPALESRLFNRLPPNYRQAYKTQRKSTPEWISRAHLIIDFIAGMTDHFALRTHQLLEGIQIE